MLSCVLLLKEHFTPKKKPVVISSPPCWWRVGGSFVICETFPELHGENGTWNGFELLVRRRPDLWKQQEFKWILKRCFLHLQHQSRTWCIVWWLSCKTTESLHPDDYCTVFKPNFDILSLSIIIFCYLILPFRYILETNVLFYFTAFIWATTDYSYKFRLRAASEPDECMCVRLTYFFQQYHENKLQKNAEYQIW